MPVLTAVIGAGNWGVNIIKTLHKLSGVDLVVGNNIDKTNLSVLSISPKILTTTDIKDLINNPVEQKVAFIATPINTHSEIAKLLLSNNIHCFVEKPLSFKKQEILELYKLAEDKHKLLQTGYIYLYDTGLLTLKNIVKDSDNLELDLTWKKFGSFNSGIVENLLVHELATAITLLGKVTSPKELIVKENFLKISLVHERGTSNITIDRDSQERVKTLYLKTSGGAEYRIENNELRNDEKIICKQNESGLLEVECKQILERLQKKSISNTKSMELDTDIAEAVTEILRLSSDQR